MISMEVKIQAVLSQHLQGTSLKEVADGAGVPKSLIADWRDGRCPSPKNLGLVSKLASYFGLTLEQLLFGKDIIGHREIIASMMFREGEQEYILKIERKLTREGDHEI